MKRVLFPLILFFLPVLMLNGQETPVIQAGTRIDGTMIPLQYYVVREDTTAELTIADLESITALPTVSKKNVERFRSAYWLSFEVDGGANESWFLEFVDPHINDIEVYSLLPGGIRKWKRAGMDVDFSEKEFNYKNYLYQVDFDKAQRQRFFVRIKSDTKTSFLFKFRSVENTVGEIKQEYLFLGIFYGIILITIVTNLIFFLFIRERIHLYYSLYLFGCSLLFLSEDALGFELFWPHKPVLNHIINFYSPILLVVSFTLYANRFLKIENYFSRYKTAFRVVITVSVLYYLFNALTQSHNVDYRFYIVPFAVIFVSGIAIWRKGSRAGRYFVIAHSFMLVGIIFLVIRKAGIDVPASPYTFFSLNAGFVIEIAILSYALGERIREFKSLRIKAQEKLLHQLKSRQETQKQLVEQLQENQRLKDKLNEDLEREVEKRSREIIDQNEIIFKQNTELVEANMKLLEQAEEINKLNEKLDLDNWALKNNIRSLTEARILSKAVDFAEFSKLYPDQNSCLKFLADKKWGNNYNCRKCGSQVYCAGRTPYSRRCTRCRYEESATAYTLLHKCKIPLEKAFYAIFLVFSSKGKITSVDLSNKLNIRQSTCWTFMNKINGVLELDRNAWQKGWDAILVSDMIEQE